MNRPFKRTVSLILCVLMCLSIMPVPAFARDEGPAFARQETVQAAAKNAAKPKITSNPKSVTTTLKAKVTLTVKAKGKGLKYQWYYRTSSKGEWKKLKGKTKATLTVTGSKKLNGYQYRCLVSNKKGQVYSKAAKLKVLNFTIKAQPKDQTVNQSTEASFKVSVSGSGVKYQWYYRTSASGSWAAVSGATKSTLSVPSDYKKDGYQFRCRLSNKKGKVFSDTATLHVTSITITGQPADQAVRAGDPASFSVVVEGQDFTYQWYQRTSSDGSWTALAGQTSSSLTLTAEAAMDGYQYRCEIRDGADSLYSAAATLRVSAITGQPADRTVRVGETASFTVKTSGLIQTYRWQQRTSSDEEWKPLDGQTSSTLTVTAEMEKNGYEYRCEVADAAGSMYSDPAALHVVDTRITDHPAGQTVKAGGTAAFAVAAVGQDLSYQWQQKAPGGDWTDMAGETDTSLTFTAEAAMDGCQFRCHVIDELDSQNPLYSEAAELCVVDTAITGQPVDQTVRQGGTASFTVTARGRNLAYQWYCRTSADGDWQLFSGQTGATMSLAAAAGQNGHQFRCEITDKLGDVYTSDAATLHIVFTAITGQPADQTVRAGTEVSFTVAADGKDLSYQWQQKASGGDWTDMAGETGTSLTFTAAAAMDGCQFRCHVIDELDSQDPLYSEAAGLCVVDTKITGQPVDQTVRAGQEASFTVAADGKDLSYQWQQKAPGGDWTDMAGKTGAALTVTAEAGQDGYQFRCGIRDVLDDVYTSETATLHVVSTEITGQPADQTVRAGTEVSFTVVVRGKDLRYQWQQKAPDGDWADIAGETGTSLTFTAEAAMDSLEYRCVVSDAAGSIDSDPAVLRVVAVTAQPADLTVRAGKPATFTVETTGPILGYQWQYKRPSSQTWTNMESTTTCGGVRSTQTGHNLYEFRCEITDALGSFFTDTAVLRVVDIEEQPTDQSVRAGGSAEFTVKTFGSVTRQWYYKYPSSQTWHSFEGQTSTKLTVQNLKRSQDGIQIRCGVTYTSGGSSTEFFSDTVTLTVRPVVYRALLVGEANFHSDSLNPSNRNRLDVEMMEGMLGGIQGPGYASYTVNSIFNVSTEQVREAISTTFAGATEDDVSLFFIASHGELSAEGDDAGAIVTVGASEDEHMKMSQLASWLSAVPGEVIVFIGSCGSGAAIYSNGLRSSAAADAASFTQKVVDAFAAANKWPGLVSKSGEFIRSGKFYVLTSAAYQEESCGFEDLGNLFPRAIVRGVGSEMPADFNRDGKVSLQELYTYVYDYVSGYYSQHVQVYPENSTYELFKKK